MIKMKGNSNKYLFNVDEITAEYVENLVGVLKEIDFTDMNQVIMGATVMSNIMDVVFNRASKSCLQILFGDDEKNDEFLTKVLLGEYNPDSVHDFFKDVDSDISEDILFFSETIDLVLSKSIKGVSSDEILDMLWEVE